MMKSFYAALTAWQFPGYAVFVQRTPNRNDAYDQATLLLDTLGAIKSRGDQARARAVAGAD